MTSAADAVPGWYGKVPSLGDFASRRLPAEFIGPWDRWLQEMLQATRISLGEAWPGRYLTTPIWRFVLSPGFLTASGWAGILMPSVDRVGRYFPLTVATALPMHAAVAHAVFDGAAWFSALEEATLGALDPVRDVEDLDRTLAAQHFAYPALPDPDASAGGSFRRLTSTDAFVLIAKADAVAAWSASLGWQTLWWTRGRLDGDPLMLTSPGLPSAQEFLGMVETRCASAPGRDATAVRH